MTGTNDDIRSFADILELHRSELGAMLALNARLQMQMLDDNLELLVPASYRWGEPGDRGFMSGIEFRVMDGIEHLYLAHKVVAP